MGDSYIERLRSQFRSWAKVPVLVQLKDQTLADANIRAHQTIARTGRARRDEPALKSDRRAWLERMDGATDETLLAFARHADIDADTNVNAAPNADVNTRNTPEKGDPTVLVFANMENDAERTATFRLDDETRKRIDPDRQYNVRNLLSARANESLWAAPEADARCSRKASMRSSSPTKCKRSYSKAFRRDCPGGRERAILIDRSLCKNVP